MVPHWGYADEPLPCESDAGTCRYLNGVYVMHDLSMKYSMIMWGVLWALLSFGSLFVVGGLEDLPKGLAVLSTPCATAWKG